MPDEYFDQMAADAARLNITTEKILEYILFTEAARKQKIFQFRIHFFMQRKIESSLIRTFEACLLYRNGTESYETWTFKTICFARNEAWEYGGSINNTFALDSEVRGIIRFLKRNKEFIQSVSTLFNLDLEVTSTSEREFQCKVIKEIKI